MECVESCPGGRGRASNPSPDFWGRVVLPGRAGTGRLAGPGGKMRGRGRVEPLPPIGGKGPILASSSTLRHTAANDAAKASCPDGQLPSGTPRTGECPARAGGDGQARTPTLGVRKLVPARAGGDGQAKTACCKNAASCPARAGGDGQPQQVSPESGQPVLPGRAGTGCLSKWVRVGRKRGSHARYQVSTGPAIVGQRASYAVAGRVRAQVLGCLLEHAAGLTDEELEHALHLRPGSGRARRCELTNEGKVHDSGKTRIGECGRPMSIWVVRSAAVNPSPSPHSGCVVAHTEAPGPIGPARRRRPRGGIATPGECGSRGDVLLVWWGNVVAVDRRRYRLRSVPPAGDSRSGGRADRRQGELTREGTGDWGLGIGDWGLGIRKMMKLKMPYLGLVPRLSSDELEALRVDIAVNGVLDPIWVDDRGNILDGHTRHEIDPSTQTPRTGLRRHDRGPEEGICGSVRHESPSPLARTKR